MAEEEVGDLTQLQIAILELEMMVWKQPGNKLNEFRARYPDINPTRYTLLLLALLNDRRAYEYDNQRYAPTLNRIRQLHADRMTARGAARGVTAE